MSFKRNLIKRYEMEERSKRPRIEEPCPPDEPMEEFEETPEGVLPPSTPNKEAFEGVVPPPDSPIKRVLFPQIGGEQPEEPEVIDFDKPPRMTYELTFKQDDKRYPLMHTTRFLRRVRVDFDFHGFDGEISAISDQIDRFYRRLVTEVTMKYDPNDYYLFMARSEDLNDPIVIGFKKINTFSYKEFTNKILAISQSHQNLLMKALNVELYISNTPSGRGNDGSRKKGRAPENAEQRSLRKRSVITIKNAGNDCGYRALWVGLSYFLEHFDESENQNLRSHPPGESEEETARKKIKYNRWRSITKTPTIQKEGAKLLCLSGNRYIHDKACPEGSECPIRDTCHHFINYFDVNKPFCYDHYEMMTEMLSVQVSQFKFVIIDAENVFSDIYVGKPEGGDNFWTVYLELNMSFKGGHYNWIKDVIAYRGSAYFCDHCLTKHQTLNHRCPDRCDFCGDKPICEGGVKVDCDICRRTFMNQQCYDNHMKTNPMIGRKNKGCVPVNHCDACDLYYVNKKHKCGEFTCKHCSAKYTVSPHYCMLKPLSLDKLKKEDEVNKVIVTFDIESTVVGQGDKEEHHPNLLIANVICDKCWDKDNKCKVLDTCTVCGDDCACVDGNNACSVCGIGYFESLSYDCVKEFCDALYTIVAKTAAQKQMQVIVFAHNSKGYDGHFIMKDLFERKFMDEPDIIMSGQKVLKITINNVSFVDSLSFFQQSLASLPKSFGFENVVEKGFFPHLFNKEANLEYEGPIPAIEYFDCGSMKATQANECRQFHSNYTGVWNFKQQLIKYCKVDVEILTNAVMQFRELFKSVTELDPITRNFTLASVAMEHWRSSVLEKDTIGVTPIAGYVNNRHQSMKANIWLDWLQTTDGRILREQKIGKYYVDGLKDNVVYEFFGCYFHGCPECQTEDRDEKQPNLEKSFRSLYSDTERKIEYFESRHYELRIIWEHDYDQLCVSDESLHAYYRQRFPYYQKIKAHGHTQIRDAFFGGRTNNLFFNHECAEDEVIKYNDVTSLYPYVLVSHEYPLGHPEVISEFNNIDISSYFGFIKCKVLAPRDLYIPVLPVRDDGKLIFPLCSLCCEGKSIDCAHSDNERHLTGTWFSEELKLAITKGYVIKEIIEVLHYDQTSREVFKPYIQKWLKIKTEASGWPSTCIDDVTREVYIDEFSAREGVDLEPNNIEVNPGKRFIAKLMLNSLWGKLAQRPNQGSVTICTEYEQFFKLISDKKIEIKGFIPINDNTFVINHCFIDDCYDNPRNTNIAIAAMVTAYARMKLYSLIDDIEASEEGRVLYFDTDSVIFRDKPEMNWYCPPLGNFLGDMTDEIDKDFGSEARAIKFASGGPKNYAYIVQTPDGQVPKLKIKGINLTDGVEGMLPFGRVEKFAKKFREENRRLIKRVPQTQFRSDCGHNVFTFKFDKKYRVVSDKRIIIPDGFIQTIPFGYKK